MAKKYEITNNTIALIILIFTIVAITGNYVIHKTAEESPVKKGVGSATSGFLRICINTRPIINGTCDSYGNVNQSYYCNVSGYDPNNDNINFSDNTSLFNISQEGIINFTPISNDIGTHLIDINVTDDSGCTNNAATALLNLTICSEPIWDNFKNSLTTNLSLLGCWNRVENFTIGIPNKGLVDFTQSIIDIDGYDFDTYLNISHNYISVNATALSSLNRTATITIFNLSFINVIIIKDNTTCSDCMLISYDGNLTFNVTSFDGTYFAKERAILSLSDSTDNLTRYVDERVDFFADLRYHNNTIVSNAICRISFDITGNYSDFSNMNYNTTRISYTYNRTFSSPGNFIWNVQCNITNYILGETDNVIITNRAPVLIAIVPNETWNEDTTLTGRDLDNYFSDPDGDILSYTSSTVNNIHISIDPTTHIVTYTPDANFFGNRTVIFTATDPLGLSAESNIVYLLVIDVPEPEAAPPVGGAWTAICPEDWECSDYGPCLPTGIQVRKCIDLNNCGSARLKPDESKECVYTPTCFDNIMNGREEGVDCGGPCPPCPTCYDGIQNQNEEGIDCGGPCPRCPTCFDGLKNGEEAGIDCGGPCPKCPTCYDGIQNGYETGIDCGGPCPACPTCFDNIQNQGETGVDCGGPCRSCLEFPIKTGSILTILLLIIIVALIVLYTKFRRKIKYKMERLRFLIKKPEIRIVEEEFVKKIAELRKKIGKVRSVDIFDELFYAVKGLLTNSLGIDYEFTEEELKKELVKKRVKKEIVERIMNFYSKLENIRFGEKVLTDAEVAEYLQEAKNIVKDVISIKSITKDVMRGFEELMKQAHDFLKKKDMVKAKITYIKMLELYKKLDDNDKVKVYGRIKELHERIAKDKKKGKGVVLLLFFVIASLLIFSPSKIGFVVLEAAPIIQDIPEQHLTVGETFTYQVIVEEGFGKLDYLDNTRLFDITDEGIIEFTPGEQHTGIRTAVVVVEDENKNYDFRLIKFNISENG